MNDRRKVCVVIASRANYGRVKTLVKAIQERDDLELQVIVGASMLLERFGKAVNILKEDGFIPDRSIHYVIEGETLETQAKSTGLGIVEITTALGDLDPDMVVSVADRYETMATAVATTYLNKKLIHLQGGEVSGNIDDRVRHAITKLADYHFVCTEESRERVIRMGEHAGTVFNYGCPAIDIVAHSDQKISNEIMSKYGGVGSDIDWSKPYALIIQHPVTTSFGSGFAQMTETLQAAHKLPVQKVCLWPNSDAGSDFVSKAIRVFREKHADSNFHFYRNFSPEDFIRVLANARVCIGNSSSFIREGAFLGTPSLIVGDRQRQREHGQNVRFADYKREEILGLSSELIEKGRFPSDNVFGDGQAGKKIAEELTRLDLTALKSNSY